MGQVTDRLRFAVELAECDLDTLAAEDWSRLQDRLSGFLVSTVGGVTTGADPPDCSRADLRSLKASLREVLRTAARGLSQAGPRVAVRVGLMRLVRPTATTSRARAADTPRLAGLGQRDTTDDAWVAASTSAPLTRPHQRPVRRNQRGLKPRDTRFLLTVSGGVLDCVLAVLTYLLAHEPVDRIRQCPCGRLFIRRRAQRFCAVRACQQARTARYWKAYAATPQGQAARRRQYEKHGWAFGARAKRSRGATKTGQRAPAHKKRAVRR